MFASDHLETGNGRAGEDLPFPMDGCADGPLRDGEGPETGEQLVRSIGGMDRE